MPAKAKPCPICGGEKPPIRGARYCEVCKAASAAAAADRAAQAKAEGRHLAKIASGSVRRVSKRMTPDGMKWCARCERFLPLEKFAVRKNGRVAPYCPPCSRSYHHEHHVRNTFGLQPGQYDEMLVEQGGRCAICGNRPKKYRLAVDHDHKSGEVRGLLCGRCNKDLLGAARDDIEVLKRAVAYLMSPPAQHRKTVVPEAKTVDDGFTHVLQRIEREHANAGTTFAVSFIKRPRARTHRWIAVLTLEQFCTLLREATRP